MNLKPQKIIIISSLSLFMLNAQIALPTFQGMHHIPNDGSGCTICDTDLVLYFNFESGSGSVPDLGISGNTTNGSFQGTANYYSGGKYGSYSMQSPSGSGEDDYMGISGDITDLDMPSEYSFMAWVKIIGGSGGQGIILLGACCSPRQGYTLSIKSSGHVRFWGGSDSNSANYNTYYNTSINNGSWHHIGVRANSTTLQILVNGTVGATGSTNVPTSPSEANPDDSHAPNNPQIGGEGISSTDGFDVLIDEVRVYKSYLSDSEWTAAMSGSW